ncbi:MAG: universal stress protein [Vicinamibacterales bacterium]
MTLTIVLVTAVLLAAFVFVWLREMPRTGPHAEPDPGEELAAQASDLRAPLRLLLAVDGSPASLAAVQDLASCHLPAGTSVELLTVLHSHRPLLPDPAFVAAAALAEDLAHQRKRAPEIQQTVADRLRRHRPHVTVTTKMVEGSPADVILQEAESWNADRIVLGASGHGQALGRLGSTAAAVAARARCSVQIARPPRTSTSDAITSAAH